MKYIRTKRFEKSFRRLPKHIQAKFIKAFSQFITNQQHPSLHTKKMQGHDNVWEARVDLSYRFTFHYEIIEIENETDSEDDTLCILRNIGSHDILNKSP